MYDLTSFLTTISAGSASFVAILGGLIAQKVIEINNERTAVEEEIKELQEQKVLLEDEIADREDWIEEDNAISFIGRHAKELLQGNDFSDAADPDDLHGYEDLESLEAYWKEAQSILNLYAENAEKPHYDLVSAVKEAIRNDEARDRVKIVSTADLRDEMNTGVGDDTDNYDVDVSDSFITNVCEIIKDHFKAYYRNNGMTAAGQFIAVPYALGRINGYGVSEATYYQWGNEKSRLVGELSAVELRIKQSEDRKRRLRVPNEMKKGFWIFGHFIALCVLLPLILTPLVMESYTVFVVVKIISLLIFGAGLYSILLYIMKLLPKMK